MDALWDKFCAGPGRAADDMQRLKADNLPLVLYGDGWAAP